MSDWTISKVEYKADPDINVQVLVTMVHWRATLVDGPITATVYGSVGSETERSFTPVELAAITEAAVVGWVQDEMGPAEVAQIEAGLAADVAYQQTPTTGTMSF